MIKGKSSKDLKAAIEPVLEHGAREPFGRVGLRVILPGSVPGYSTEEIKFGSIILDRVMPKACTYDRTEDQFLWPITLEVVRDETEPLFVDIAVVACAAPKRI